MKALHLVERIDDSYGGPAKSIPLLCAGLRNFGVDSIIISANSQESKNELINKFNIPWIKCTPAINGRFYFSITLAKQLRKILPSIDVIHIHSLWTYPTLITYFLAKRLDKKIIISPRSSLFSASLEKSRLKKKIMRAIFLDELLKSSSAIIASSQQELIEARFLGDFNLALIPNGIDTAEFRSAPSKEDSRQELGLPTNRKIISFISRIHKRKGLSHLVDGWIKINRDRPDKVCLMVAGPIDDQEYFNEQLSKIEKSGLNSEFFYLGMVSGPSRVKAFKAGDLFVLPTEFENFGMCLAESMLAGVPVITSRNTPWESLNKESAGWFIDIEALPEKISEALSDNLKEFGLRACNLVTRNYSHEAMAERVSKLYLN